MHSFSPRFNRGLVLAVLALTFVLLLSGSALQAQAESGKGNGPSSPNVQRFQDVPDTYLFAPFINSLYDNGIVGGYPCGGGNPCVPPANLPYFLPDQNVTRGQLAKFLDNGRQKIGNATGSSLVISSTAYTALSASTNSGGYAIYGTCRTAGNNCYAVTGSAPAGDYAGVFGSGRGVSSNSSDANFPGVSATSSGATAYGARGYSSAYRGVEAANASTSWYALYVNSPAGSTVAGYFNGNVSIQGNLSVSGSKGGYVVDIMQNVDGSTLQAGDVVVIAGAGSSEAVVGEIPVVTVKKASSAYDTGVVGVVDQVVYVPSNAVRSQYEAEQNAVREARAAQAAAMDAAADPVAALKNSPPLPPQTISDAVGTVHADASSSQAVSGSYINVVTLGSYKAVKVDASFGAIKAGDLLVASTNPGYAMKASDKSLTSGAVIGKALGSLDSGTGMIPVMVTLK